jgi:hypothetical protein
MVAATFRRLDATAIEGLPGGLDGASPVVEVPLACDYALARLARGDAEAATAAFMAIANTASATGSFPERANLRARQADGLGPSAAAAAGFILLFRNLLLTERGDELHLGPAVPDELRQIGFDIRKAPTRFGPVSYYCYLPTERRTMSVQATIPTRIPPAAVVIHVPLAQPKATVRAVRATVGEAKAEKGTVRVTGWRGEGKVEIDLE